jgi:hypothetical protein
MNWVRPLGLSWLGLPTQCSLDFGLLVLLAWLVHGRDVLLPRTGAQKRRLVMPLFSSRTKAN